MTRTHTETPWAIETPMVGMEWTIVQAGLQAHEWRFIASCSFGGDLEDFSERDALTNAERIVHCVNTHDALVEALGMLLQALDSHGTRKLPEYVRKEIPAARAAFALAKGDT